MDVQKIPSDLRSFPSSLGTDRTLLSKVYLEQRAKNLPFGNFHKIVNQNSPFIFLERGETRNFELVLFYLIFCQLLFILFFSFFIYVIETNFNYRAFDDQKDYSIRS